MLDIILRRPFALAEDGVGWKVCYIYDTGVVTSHLHRTVLGKLGAEATPVKSESVLLEDSAVGSYDSGFHVFSKRSEAKDFAMWWFSEVSTPPGMQLAVVKCKLADVRVYGQEYVPSLDYGSFGGQALMVVVDELTLQGDEVEYITELPAWANAAKVRLRKKMKLAAPGKTPVAPEKPPKPTKKASKKKKDSPESKPPAEQPEEPVVKKEPIKPVVVSSLDDIPVLEFVGLWNLYEELGDGISGDFEMRAGIHVNRSCLFFSVKRGGTDEKPRNFMVKTQDLLNAFASQAEVLMGTERLG